MGNMSRLAQVLKSRVALSLVGAVLIGGVSAVLAVTPNTYSRIGGLFFTETTPTSASADLSGQETSTPEDATTTTVARPTPTRTPAPLGSPANPLRGAVVTVSTTSFTISSEGRHFTIDVNPSTTYGGLAHSLADLQAALQATPPPPPLPTPRLRASVIGTQESATSYLASHVSASFDE